MKKQLGRKNAVAAIGVTLLTGSFRSAQKVNKSELQFREALIVFLYDSRLTYQGARNKAARIVRVWIPGGQ
jgi:hypothetical protein